MNHNDNAADAAQYPALAAIWLAVLAAAKLGLVLLAGVTILSWLGRTHWLFELLCHFVVCFAIAAGLAAVVLLLGQQWRWSAAALVLLVIHGFALLPYFPRSGGEPASLTVLLANVHSANTQYARLLALIEQQQPDVIVVQEVDGDWEAALSVLGEKYPHQLIESREDNFGIALFSRLPIEGAIREFPARSDLPSIVATITRADGRTFDLLATHPLPPARAQLAASRNAQLASVAKHAAGLNENLLIVGDLNATPWSPYFQSLLTEARVHDGRLRQGILGTWPSSLPSTFRIPIDHVLWRGDMRVIQLYVGDETGSDHRPIIAKVQ